MTQAIDPLLQTKLHRPRVPGDLIIRRRLLEQLGQGLDRQFTLVCAPAGFGKTTLVSSWIEGVDSGEGNDPSSLPAVWLSLDENDSELSTFLRYFIAAVRTIFSEACGQTLALLDARLQPPLAVLYTTLSNEIEQLPRKFILVLDDYHSIHGDAVHNLLSTWARHWPHPMHLVLISRINPPLPLASLRAKGQISEIRTYDLRFTPEETAAYLSQAKPALLSQPIMSLLEERIEGWIAGLQLATLSVRSTDNMEAVLAILSGVDTNIADYLADEVLSRQLPAIQNFLLKTSILDRFCAPLCEAVIGEGDPAWGVSACIDWLERAELFITPLDNRKEWYRYHHIFRDLLQARLSAEMVPEQVKDLHRRAAGWFERQGLVDEALKHATLANDLDLAAGLMVQGLREVLNREDRPTLERWLRLLPGAFIQKRPELLMIKAWALQFSWQFEAQAKVLRQVEALLEAEHDTPPPAGDRQALRGQLAGLKAQHAYFSNQPKRARAYCQEALMSAPESWTYLRSGIMLYLGLSLRACGENGVAERFLLEHHEALSDKTDAYALRLLNALCLIYLHNGDLDQAYQTARTMYTQAAMRGLAILEGWAGLFLGTVLYQWNDLEAASRHFDELARRRYTTHVLAVGDGITGRALIHQIRGESAQAWQMVDLLSQIDLERMGAEEDRTRSLRARLRLLEGDLDGAYRWADSFTTPPSEQPLTWLEMPHLTLGRILLARKRPADVLQAHQVLDVLDDIAERTYNTRAKIEILALRALAFDAQGNTGEALSTLQEAIDLARPGGFVRVFADLGAPMQELLDALARKGQSVETIHRILAAFPDQVITRESEDVLSPSIRRSPLESPGLAEPLTRRELQVLAHMREPMSAKEIALNLGISYATVKRHSINIYGKLGVNSRWEAVAKAAEQGILTAN